jgi:hypothetical protein
MNLEKWKTHIVITSMPTKSSAGATWIEWHKILKRTLGKKNANITWIKAWDMRGGKNSPASTSALREYMKGEGVVIDKTTVQSVTDFGGGVLDSIGSVFKVGKWIFLVVIGIIVGGLALLVWGLLKNPIKSISTVGQSAKNVKGF